MQVGPKFTHVTGVGQHRHNYKQVFVQEAALMLLYYSSNYKRQPQNGITSEYTLKHISRIFKSILVLCYSRFDLSFNMTLSWLSLHVNGNPESNRVQWCMMTLIIKHIKTIMKCVYGTSDLFYGREQLLQCRCFQTGKKVLKRNSENIKNNVIFESDIFMFTFFIFSGGKTIGLGYKYQFLYFNWFSFLRIDKEAKFVAYLRSNKSQ